MKRPLITFLLFYLLGATFSPALASTDMAADQGLWMAIGEDVPGVGQEWSEWLSKSPEFDGDNQSYLVGHFNARPSFLADDLATAKPAKALQNKAVKQPLYLLFHSLVFYDLH